MKDYGPNTPLRISRELDDEVVRAVKRLKMSKQEVMRLALAVGLEDLKSIDYKVARVLVDAAKAKGKA